MTAPATDTTRMVTELVRLHQALQDISLPLDLAGAEAGRRARAEMIDQLEDYVIPRMMTLDAPLLAVVGGSTGAGKSTLVNSLVGTRVTAPGVLRPTTRSPVLVHHPDDAQWFGQDRLLPELVRVDHATDDPKSLQLIASDLIKPGLAILDAPDVDSVEEQNRLLAAELLAAADLWLFVTSAARYADQVPWEFLKAAAERSTAVAVVLDRTPADAVQTVATHLARMLAARGLKDSPLFIVHEGEVSAEGLLPARHVAEVRGWLDMLADDAVARQTVVAQTLDGAVRALTFNVHKVADVAAGQAELATQVRGEAESAYATAIAAVDRAATDGTLLSGEVLARWQEFVGTGELLRSLEHRVGRLRDRMVGAIKGKPQQADDVNLALCAALELLVLEHAEIAAEAAERAWQSTEAGRGLLVAAPGDLGRASRALRTKAARAVEAWQQDVLGLVRAEGAERTARYLAYGANGLAVSLMIAVFASTAEVESAALGERLLEAVFGEGTVRDLVRRARESLEGRVAELLGEERARFTDLVDALVVDPEAPARLRQAARRVDDLRWASQRHSPLSS